MAIVAPNPCRAQPRRPGSPVAPRTILAHHDSAGAQCWCESDDPRASPCSCFCSCVSAFPASQWPQAPLHLDAGAARHGANTWLPPPAPARMTLRLQLQSGLEQPRTAADARTARWATCQPAAGRAMAYGAICRPARFLGRADPHRHALDGHVVRRRALLRPGIGRAAWPRISAEAAALDPGQPLVFRLADAVLDQAGFDGDIAHAPAEALAQGVTGELVAAADRGPATAAASLPTRRLVRGADRRCGTGAAGWRRDRDQHAGAAEHRRRHLREPGGRAAAVAAASPCSTPTPSLSRAPIRQALLEELKTYRGGTPHAALRGLSHLMTGRNLDGRTVGIAYIGGACAATRFSASLSEARSDVQFDALVAAHEIGHMCSAHRMTARLGRPARPRTANLYLMAPQLNGRPTFSPCSLEQIAPVVARAVLPGADRCGGRHHRGAHRIGAAPRVCPLMRR